MENRFIKLDGSHNFRDIGNIRNKDNLLVKKNLLFRSDSLANLTNNDLEILKQLNIKTIIDYRYSEEIKQKPSKILEGATTYNFTPIANVAAFVEKSEEDFKDLKLEDVSEEMVDKMFIEQNIRFVNEEISKEAYTNLLNILLDENNTAILQHCTAGKDRTGYGVALILALLDVSREDIIKDYMLSLRYSEAKPLEKANSLPIFKYISNVKEVYIESALDELDKYGGAREYVINELGFKSSDIDKLKAIYLEKERVENENQ